MASSGGSWKGGKYTPKGIRPAPTREQAQSLIADIRQRPRLDGSGLARGAIVVNARTGAAYEITGRAGKSYNARGLGYQRGGRERSLGYVREVDRVVRLTPSDFKVFTMVSATRDEVASLMRGSRVIQQARRQSR